MTEVIIRELAAIRQLLEEKKSRPNDRLVSSGQVLARLGMKHDDKAWHKTRKLLIERYGMNRTPGTGYRMLEGQLNKYIEDYYSPIR
jgi:hypothetical protein